MVVRASHYLITRVLILQKKKTSLRNIQKILKREIFLITLTSIHSIVRKYQKHTFITDIPGKGRKFKLGRKVIEFIIETIKYDRDISHDQLKELVINFSKIKVCDKTVYNACLRAKWIKKQTRYCQIVSKNNAIKRLLYCHFCL